VLRAKITISVSPGARRSELVGRHAGGWKVRVAAPPERNRANEALVDLLASVLELSRESITLVAGHSSRRKVVEIHAPDDGGGGRRLDAAARKPP
jgi:uncharacterized protein